MATPNENTEAFALALHSGFEAGARADGWAGLCPYGHNQPGRRLAWFDGFSKGRTKLIFAGGAALGAIAGPASGRTMKAREAGAGVHRSGAQVE